MCTFTRAISMDQLWRIPATVQRTESLVAKIRISIQPGPRSEQVHSQCMLFIGPQLPLSNTRELLALKMFPLHPRQLRRRLQRTNLQGHQDSTATLLLQG